MEIVYEEYSEDKQKRWVIMKKEKVNNKKIFKFVKWILVAAIVVVFFHQVITLVLPEGRKAEAENEVYQMEIREYWSPHDSDWHYLKYNKVNNGPYDLQYSEKIDKSCNSINADVMEYKEYCEMCKEYDISQRYTNQDADYIVWKAYSDSIIRLDLINVIARDDLATIYLKSTTNFLRGKNRSGRIIIIPIEKGIVDHAGVGKAYRFEFERPVSD